MRAVRALATLAVTAAASGVAGVPLASPADAPVAAPDPAATAAVAPVATEGSDFAASPAARRRAEHEAASTVVEVRDDGDGIEVVTRRLSSPEEAEAAAAAALDDPGVVAASVDRVATLAAAATTYDTQQWGLDRLGATDVWGAGHDAEGQVIAVLDTGVDASHLDLAPVTRAGADFVEPGGDGRSDPHGHGTHVAGIAAAVADDGSGVSGLAWNAEILPVRVVGTDGAGSSGTILQGIDWAVDHGATVINLSLVIEEEQTPLDSLFDTVIAHAEAEGVVVVAAAGNKGESTPRMFPAAHPDVIGVAATAPDDTRAPFSSVGDWVDVAAPGQDIYSTVPGGGFSTSDGTSMASPFVAAAAAVLQASEPALSPAQVRARLRETALDLGTPGTDTEFGHGLISPSAALAPTEPPATTTTTAPTTTTSTTAQPTTTTTTAAAPTTTTAAPTTTTSTTAAPTTTSTAVPPSTVPPPSLHQFRDVTRSGAFGQAVSWLAGTGITEGCDEKGNFCPNASVTRGQMATFLWRDAGEPTRRSTSRFTDVPADNTHAGAISWLAAAGITGGCDEKGNFCPDRPVSRSQMAAFLWRLESEPTAAPYRFTDVPSGDRFAPAISWLARTGVTGGCDKAGVRFCPGQSVTRVQMALFLHRLGTR